MKKALSVIMILAFAISLMSVAAFTGIAEDDCTLIYHIDFEEEYAGSVLMSDGEIVGEVVEWPVGSGNHALKYVIDSTTYKPNGSHPIIYPFGIGGTLSEQGNIPPGGEIDLTISVGCDDLYDKRNADLGLYLYAMMITNDDKENYFDNRQGTFLPGNGCFKTGKFSLSSYTDVPIPGTLNGGITLIDDFGLGANMIGKAFYYDDIILEWKGPWTPITDWLLCYRDTMVPFAKSDVNDAYINPPPPIPTTEETSTTTTPTSNTRLSGDVNDDGILDMKDVLAIRKYLAGLTDEIDKTNADANMDESLDMKDVLIIRKHLAGILEESET